MNEDQDPVQVEHYILGKTLGIGVFGKVCTVYGSGRQLPHLSSSC